MATKKQTTKKEEKDIEVKQQEAAELMASALDKLLADEALRRAPEVVASLLAS